MSLVNVISAIGNNKSIYPILIRDCCIENPTRIFATYNENKSNQQNAKSQIQEKFIDEYSVSAVWLGVIPLIDRVGKSLIRRFSGLNPDVNLKLISEDENFDKKMKIYQKISSKGFNAQKPENIQGFEYNINKFKNIKGAEDAVKDMLSIKNCQKSFKKLMNTKFLASVIVPITLMSVVVPKVLSRKSKMTDTELMKPLNREDTSFGSTKTFEQFVIGNQNMTTFQGGITSFLAGLTTVQKMALTDGGYATERIITARDKNEAFDLGFKLTGMMFLNYWAPQWFEKGLNKITDVSLDPKLLADKRFLASIRYNHLDLPKSDSAKDIIDFIDNNPKSVFSKVAAKAGKIKFIKNTNVRDPRVFIDIEDLVKFKKNIQAFSKKAFASGDVVKYAKRAMKLRTTTILGNIMFTSLLLAYGLPKIQSKVTEYVSNIKSTKKVNENDKLNVNKL